MWMMKILLKNSLFFWQPSSSVFSSLRGIAKRIENRLLYYSHSLSLSLSHTRQNEHKNKKKCFVVTISYPIITVFSWHNHHHHYEAFLLFFLFISPRFEMTKEIFLPARREDGRRGKKKSQICLMWQHFIVVYSYCVWMKKNWKEEKRKVICISNEDILWNKRKSVNMKRTGLIQQPTSRESTHTIQLWRMRFKLMKKCERQSSNFHIYVCKNKKNGMDMRILAMKFE